MTKTARLIAVTLTVFTSILLTPPALGASTKRVALVQTLVERGQKALEKGQLTDPTYDNAYDHFTAALLLDSENVAAKAGLQAVLLGYIERIEKSLRTGRLQTAQGLLSRALKYYPDQGRLLELQASLKEALKVQADAGLRAAGEEGVIELPIHELDARGEAIRARLGAVAQKIRDTDASVLIFARTDAEGRYIYSVLKAAAPGYRIRGDIRVHPRPHLQLKEPL